MKKILWLLIISSCITLAQEVAIDTNIKKPLKAEYGFLVVQTATSSEKLEFNNEVKTFTFHKPYVIFDDKGNQIMDIKKSYKDAEKVKLPAGNYVIIAEVLEGYKDLFDITIEVGKTFEIDKSLVEKHYADM